MSGFGYELMMRFSPSRSPPVVAAVIVVAIADFDVAVEDGSHRSIPRAWDIARLVPIQNDEKRAGSAHQAEVRFAFRPKAGGLNEAHFGE